MLAYVGDEQPSVGTERASPRIPEPPGVLFVEAGLADEWVILGDTVKSAATPTGHVDAEDTPQEVLGDILSVTAFNRVVPVVGVAVTLVIGRAAVTDGNVE